jgi:ADP-ribose pyrophosphatase
MEKWIIHNKGEIFNKSIFKINNLECFHPGKNISHNFYVIDTPDWINVIALTQDRRFILVKQHRLGTDEITIETPAGLIENGENPETAARRELLEETGYVADDIIFLKKLSSNPSIMNNYIYFFLATGCRKISVQNLDKSENIEIGLLTVDEILDRIKSNSINHSIIITAFSLYFLSPYSNLDVSYF